MYSKSVGGRMSNCMHITLEVVKETTRMQGSREGAHR